ncbi:paral putative regulator [Clostridium sp. CAG:1013]|nr:paral putative regulator [Clostridium sp. CAG:1013]
MSEELLTLRPIAHIHTQFPEKFGIPRQSGLVEDLRARVVFEREYRIREAFRGLEDFSHLWLLWQFTESRGWSPTVRPPRLGGNQRMGVFATRSPFRPNPIGLSCVKLEGVDYDASDGPALLVRGADLLDGTPILDVKPYVPLADCRPDAKGSFSDDHREDRLSVDIPPALLEKVAQDLRPALLGVLSQDPRPSYQKDPERVYGMAFAEMEIKFTVDGDTLHVIEIAQA